MKRFDFNKILIIESIDPKQTVHYQVGEDLKKKIDIKIIELKAENKVPDSIECSLIHVQSCIEWENLWNQLVNDAKSGSYPIIHFVCHGAKEGMAIWDNNQYIMIPWKRVLDKIRAVNIITRNNTFVTMCVCYGFYSMLNLYSNDIIPFCGLFASTKPVNNLQADISFPDLYARLLSNGDIVDAFLNIQKQMECLKKRHPNIQMDNIISFTDELFIRNFNAVIEKKKDEDLSRKEITAQIEKFPETKDLPAEEKANLVNQYMKEWRLHINDVYKRMRDKKFMLDKYPDEIDRYDFPDKIL